MYQRPSGARRRRNAVKAKMLLQLLEAVCTSCIGSVPEVALLRAGHFFVSRIAVIAGHRGPRRLRLRWQVRFPPRHRARRRRPVSSRMTAPAPARAASVSLRCGWEFSAGIGANAQLAQRLAPLAAIGLAA